MMIKQILIPILAMPLIFTSCLQQEKTTEKIVEKQIITVTDTGSDTDIGDSTDPTVDPSLANPYSFTLFAAGTINWYPKVASGSHSETFITPFEAKTWFSTDQVLKVRFKVEEQEIPGKDEVGCYGRDTDKVDPYSKYEKLKFKVYLRDIKCSDGSSQCGQSQYVLGPRYSSAITVGPVNVGESSGVIDLTSKMNHDAIATTVEIADVSSDYYCNPNNAYSVYCPAEKIMRKADCWKVVMEVQTSFTQSL